MRTIPALFLTAMRFLPILVAGLLALLPTPGPAQASTAAPPPVLVVVGDSISAGYGLAPGQVWVALLEARLKAEGYPHRVVNASITGDTTAGGRARMPAVLAAHKPAVVVIELGGNDALRGQPLAQTRHNLDGMVALALAAGAQVLLLGMKVPPNYGPMYMREFDAAFADVAKARRVPLVPYLFAGFGEQLELFQPDRIHPTAEAQAKILDNVWPSLRPLLGKARR
jgi:acyl-CoA thioesterase-1